MGKEVIHLDTEEKIDDALASLTPKQAAFFAEYLESENGTQSAIAAGYSKKAAHVQGNTCLNHPVIHALVLAHYSKALDAAFVTRERVIGRIAAIASADINDFGTWGDHGFSPKASHELTKEQTGCIKSIEEKFGSNGEKTLKLVLHDPQAAQEKLCKYLGLYERDNNQGVTALGDMLADIRGIPVTVVVAPAAKVASGDDD